MNSKASFLHLGFLRDKPSHPKVGLQDKLPKLKIKNE